MKEEMTSNEKIIYYEYLIRYNYPKLFEITPTDDEDKLYLSLALAAGSTILCPATPPDIDKKITDAHRHVYKMISKDFSAFNKILSYPYKYTSLHLILRHNVCFLFGTNRAKGLSKENKQAIVRSVFNSPQEVMMALEYFFIIRTLHYAKLKRINKTIVDVLLYIERECFPLFELDSSIGKNIYDNFCKFYDTPFTSISDLKKSFKKYSTLYSYLYSVHFLGYLTHQSIINFPNLWNGIDEIMLTLKSVHLEGAKYVLSYIYDSPPTNFINFSGVEYERYYYI